MVSGLTGNAAIYSAPPVLPAALTTLVSAYATAKNAAVGATGFAAQQIWEIVRADLNRFYGTADVVAELDALGDPKQSDEKLMDTIGSKKLGQKVMILSTRHITNVATSLTSFSKRATHIVRSMPCSLVLIIGMHRIEIVS